MSTLNVKVAGAWTPIAGDVNASNPVNDYITANTPTPWTPLPFAANWVNTPGYSAGYRKIGDIVTLRGMAQRANSVTSGTVAIAQLPAGFFPIQFTFLVGGRNDGYTNLLQIDTSGVISFVANGPRATLAIGEWITLNQVSYSLTV